MRLMASPLRRPIRSISARPVPPCKSARSVWAITRKFDPNPFAFDEEGAPGTPVDSVFGRLAACRGSASTTALVRVDTWQRARRPGAGHSGSRRRMGRRGHDPRSPHAPMAYASSVNCAVITRRASLNRRYRFSCRDSDCGSVASWSAWTRSAICRTVHSCGLSKDRGIGFGCGDFDRHPNLVEAERAHAEPLGQVREVPQLFGHVGPGTPGCLCHAETLSDPGAARGCPLGPPRLSPVQFSDSRQQASLCRCDHTAEPFGLVHQVGRRCLFNYELHIEKTVAPRAETYDSARPTQSARCRAIGSSERSAGLAHRAHVEVRDAERGHDAPIEVLAQLPTQRTHARTQPRWPGPAGRPGFR